MKLRPEQLDDRLAAQAPAIFLVSGNEPLLVDECLESIRAHAQAVGATERQVHFVERGFDWAGLAGNQANLSLFSAGRLLELRLSTASPGDAGSRQLQAWAAEPPTGDLIVVVTPAIDGRTARSRWVMALERAGAWIDCRPPAGRHVAPWLRRRLTAAGLRCEPEALDILAARVEGNLLAAKQEIDRLRLTSDGEPITAEQMHAVVADGARFDVFQLADAAVAGHAERALRVLWVLEREGVAPVLVLWALAREILVLTDVHARMQGGTGVAQACRAAGVWQSRTELVARAVRQRGAQDFRALLAMAAHADKLVKGAGSQRAWPALTELTLALCGAAAIAGELAA